MADPTPIPPREAAAQQRREQLIQAAITCFLQRGVQVTPVSAIVKQAGVAQGTFYLYFRSKNDIVDELRKRLFAGYLDQLTQVAQRDAPADEVLAAVVLAMAHTVHRQLDLEQIVRSASTADDSQRIALHGRAVLFDAAKALFRRGRTQGHFTVQDPGLTGAMLVTLLDNALYESTRFGRPGPIRQVVPATVGVCLRSFGVPEPRLAQLLANLDLSDLPDTI